MFRLLIHIPVFRTFLILGVFCVAGTSAFAQSVNPALTTVRPALPSPNSVAEYEETVLSQKPVRQRIPPDYAYAPIAFRGFLLFPQASLQEEYNSNIFVRETDPDSDFITSVRPGMAIQKDIGPHSFVLGVQGDLKRYNTHKTENVENYGASFKGLIGVRNGLAIPVQISYDVAHVERVDERNGSFAGKPLQFETFFAKAGLVYKGPRIGLDLSLSRKSRRNEDGFSPSSGEPVIRSDDDRDINTLQATVAYGFHPDYKLFVTERAEQNLYKKRIFENGTFSGIKRDNLTLTTLAGLGVDVEGILSANLGAGVTFRDYDESGIESTRNFAAEGEILWNITPLTTGTLTLERAIVDSNDVTKGVLDTRIGLAVDHEFRRNLVLGGFVETVLSDYSDDDREDESLFAGAFGDYKISPALSLQGEYRFGDRDSTEADKSYTQHIVLLRLNGKL